MRVSALLLIFASALTFALAEENVANIIPCADVSSDWCSIKEVRINPCGKKRCILHQGSVGHMAIDFTPNFDATNMKFGLFWDNNGDVPYPGLESDNACNYTACPVQSGISQTLTYSLPIGKKVPKNTYLFKCKFWNPENVNQACCFETEVKVVK